MVGRNHHKMLSWEKRRIVERTYQINVLSDALYKLQKVFGKERLYKIAYTWGSGITFTGVTRKELSTIKLLLPKMSKLTKSSNEYGLTMKGTFAEKEIKDYKVTLTVDFKWGLPDTCEIEYKDVIKDANPEHYFVENGVIKHKTKESVVNCDKPLMEAVFSAG